MRDEARVLGKGHTMKFQMHYIKDFGLLSQEQKKASNVSSALTNFKYLIGI